MWIEEKLDRIVTNDAWRIQFPFAVAYSLENFSSDHLPILLDIRTYMLKTQAKQFKFENSWLRELACHKIISNTWQQHSDEPVDRKLGFCGDVLYTLGADLRNLHPTTIENCKKLMRNYRGSRVQSDMERFKHAKQQFISLLHDREVHWKQRSKVFWLKEGDSNTQIFHAMATNKFKKNNFT